MSTDTLLITEYLSKESNVILAFLFGSKSKAKTSQFSDYDIGIWVKNESDITLINKIWEDLECMLHANVDLIILNIAKPTIAWSAMRGIKLCIKDFQLFINLFLSISREAEDNQDFIIELYEKKWGLQNGKFE